MLILRASSSDRERGFPDTYHKSGLIKSPYIREAYQWYQCKQLCKNQVYEKSRLSVLTACCYEPLTGPTKGRYWKLWCMKHARAEPKIIAAMSVYALRLPLQQRITTPVVIGKQHSREESGNIQKFTFLSCLCCFQMQEN